MRDHGAERRSALRRAAVAAHWVPDVGVLLRQPGRPTVRVATWPPPVDSPAVDLSPCELRRTLLRGDGFLDDGVALEIQIITGPAAELGPFGLLRVRLEDGHRVLAVPLDGDAAPTRTELLDRGRLADAPPDGGEVVGIGFDHDVDLDATLAHVCFDPDDTDVEAQAFEALLDIAAAAAVTSLVDSVVDDRARDRP